MDTFDRIVQSLDGPMAVVTAAVDGDRSGCLVGFHAQSSIDPQRYTVWISKANHTYGVVLRATHLGVHLLTAADLEVATRFGTQTGDDTDKFAGCDVEDGPHGVPLLGECPHRIVLRRVTILDDGGDHVGVTGEPVTSSSPGPFLPLRLASVAHLDPGHEADDTR